MSKLCWCGRPHRSRGLCNTHYQALRRREYRTGERPRPPALSPSEQVALEALRHYGRETVLAEVEAHFITWHGWRIKRPNLAVALDGLVQRGLATKARVPKGHPRRYSLTPAGQAHQ